MTELVSPSELDITLSATKYSFDIIDILVVQSGALAKIVFEVVGSPKSCYHLHATATLPWRIQPQPWANASILPATSRGTPR